MTDDDNAKSSVPISSDLLSRDWLEGKKPPSYFFQQQVQTCFTEQHKILGFQISEKEQEAQIIYEKPITDLFGPKPQIESTFAKIIFDSKAEVNLNGLIEELGLLACDDAPAATTRLLDLLFVSRNTNRLLEEQAVRGVRYDLYNAEAKGKFDTIAGLSKLLSEGSKTTNDLTMMFSLIATGQNELVSAALVRIARDLNFPWDALVLARHFFGVDNEVTKMVQKIWTDAVLSDQQFKMIEIACSLKNNDMLVVARKLKSLITSKQTEPEALVQAYRCLAIFLSSNSAPQPDLKIQMKMAEASRVMCDLFMTTLGFGKIQWATQMLEDLSKRAPPGEIPSDICLIGLRCLVELNDLLLNTQKIVSPTESPKTDELEKLALKWRGKVNQGTEGMDKLKTETADSQKVMYAWIHRLCDVLRRPLSEEANLTQKMECALLAVEFLHEMIRWVVVCKEEEPLRLHWPDEKISFALNDKSIVVEVDSRRSRTISRSSRPASIANDDSKTQKRKEEHHNVQRGGNNQERTSQQAYESHGKQQQQRPLEQHSTTGRSLAPNQSGGVAVHGQAWERNQPPVIRTPPIAQDIRKLPQHIGGGDTSGAHEAAQTSPELARLGFGPNINGAPAHGSAHTGHPSNARTNSSQSARPHEQSIHPRHSNPASASSSGADISAKTHFTPSSEAISAIQKKTQYLQEAANEQSLPPTMTEQQTPPCPPKSPVQNITPEEIQSRLNESVKKNAARLEAEKEKSANEQHQPSSPSPSSTSIPQQPIMDTASASEASARRSMENVQSVEEQQQLEQPPLVMSSQQPDSHYEDLAKNQSAAPEPSVMNKLFTGGNNGQPPPDLMTAAPSSSSPLVLTQLPPSGIVLPMDNSTRTVCDSSSAMSVLTPITEASQERSRGTTAISESDAPGTANESMDDVVFTDTDQIHQPIHVDTEAVQRLNSYSNQLTPTCDDILPAGSFDNCISQNGSSVHIEEMQRQDTPTVSPQMYSPIPTETSASSEQNTVEQATEHVMDVRREAEDSNQMHQPIPAPPAPYNQQQQQQTATGSENVCAIPTMTNVQQNNVFEMTQTSGPGYRALFSSPPPPLPVDVPPVQQYQSAEIPVQQPQSFPPQAQPPMVTTYTPNVYAAAPVNQTDNSQQAGMTYQQQNAPVQFNNQQQQSHYQQAPASPSPPPIGVPPMQQYQSAEIPVQQQQPQSLPQQQVQPPMAATYTPNVYAAATVTQTDNSQQTGLVYQHPNAPVQFNNQQQQSHYQQAPPPMTAPAANYPPSETPIIPLTVECSEQELQERVTSCGIQYKFSPANVEESSPGASSLSAEMVEQQQPVQVLAPTAAIDFLSSVLGGVPESSGNEQTTTGASSMYHSPSSGGMAADENEEHAGLRRQGASEHGSEIGDSALPPFSSLPSSTVSTPQFNQQFDYSNNGGGGDATVAPPAAVQYSQYISHSSTSVHYSEPQQQPQQLAAALPTHQTTFDPAIQQQTSQSVHNGGQPVVQQSAPLPAYKDPFDDISRNLQSQQQPQPVHQQPQSVPQQHSTGGGYGHAANQNQTAGRNQNNAGFGGGFSGGAGNAPAPCFGTGTGTANDTQNFPQQQQQQSDAFGQNQNQQGDGQQKNFYGENRGHRGDRGGYRGDRGDRRGRGEGGERRGGRGGGRGRGGGEQSGSGFGAGQGGSGFGAGQSGSGFGGGNGGAQSGFGGNGFGGRSQDNQGNNQQQQQQGGNKGGGWAGGDNAHQKSNQSRPNQGTFGQQDARSSRGFH